MSKKYLLGAISNHNLLQVNQYAEGFDFSVFYRDSGAGGDQGMLYDLFPQRGETALYEGDFSKKALKICMTHGYQPWRDLDLNHDFFTEADREGFVDFCQVIKKNPDHLFLTFQALLQNSHPWYTEHLEYLICSDLNKPNKQGKTALEIIWSHYAQNLPFATREDFMLSEFLLTSQALVENGFDHKTHGEKVVRIMQDRVFNHPVFVGVKSSPVASLSVHMREFISLVEKHMIGEALKDANKKPTPLKKM